MQRSILLLLAFTALAASVRAQTVQSGLLYWCSFSEGGSNFANYVGAARANWLGFNTGFWSGPCHLPYSTLITPQWSDGFPYIYTNGSAYPYQDYSYKVAPVACLVRKFEEISFVRS